MWVTTNGTYNSSASSTATISQRNGTITVNFINLLMNLFIVQYGGSQGYVGTEVLGQSDLFLQNVTVGLLFETAFINMSSLYAQGLDNIIIILNFRYDWII